MTDGETEIDASKAPLLDHLLELRRRLLWSFGALAIAFAVCFYFVKPIYEVLVHPLEVAGQHKLVYIKLFEAFFVELKVAFFSATMLAFPIIANQLWRFVAPGLYRKEKRAALPFLIATPFLFTMGASLAYFVAIPLALKFLLSSDFQAKIGTVSQEALPSANEYLAFIMQFLFGFGLAFLLPVLLMLLEVAGLVTRPQLVAARRYAWVGAFAVAMVLAPPDAGSMLLLAVPLCILYELTLVATWFTARRRAREILTASD